MVVLKFGGTSVQSAEWMDKTLDITLKEIENSPVLVSSAMAKVTDGIISAYNTACSGNLEEALKVIEQLKKLHTDAAGTFLTGTNRTEAESAIDGMFRQFISLIKGIALLRECSPRTQDALLSYGERLSTLIIHHRALERGLRSELMDSRDLVITDDQFTSAVPKMDQTFKNIRNKVKPEPGKIIILQGFIAATEHGITTTLGRGGSDYSAAIFGAALDAGEIQIWTDVNGIMTTDPRIIGEARTIDSITYNEAGELAYFGAKVVHPATIQPAVKKNIPVYVRNTREPDHRGTAIVGTPKGSGLKAIACKKGVTVITINSSRMLNAYGFLKNIFTIFDQYKTPVDLIATSEVSVSITIDDTGSLEEIESKLSEFCNVSVENEKSIICLVGQELWKDSRFISRAFTQLSDIQIRMISLGSSDTNLSLVVPEDKTELTIRRLHKEFFG